MSSVFATPSGVPRILSADARAVDRVVPANPRSATAQRCLRPLRLPVRLASLRRRWRILPVWLIGCALGGCDEEAGTHPRASPTRTDALLVRRHLGTLARAEWVTEVTHRTRLPVNPLAMRAGAGLVSLLQGPPASQFWMFVLADSANAVAGFRIDPQEVSDLPRLGDPVDIPGITADAWTLLLDRRSGRILGQDVGGNRISMAATGVRGSVLSACVHHQTSVALIDSARRGVVFVKPLAGAAKARALTVPSALLNERTVHWSELRFGGSPDGACILYAPRMRGVGVVTDTSVIALHEFVEPLTAVQQAYASNRWYSALMERLNIGTLPRAVLDATSFPGGMALLFQGNSPEGGRMIDLYSDTGEYIESLLLPRRALRIAATRQRIVVLSESRSRVFLSSYVLPARARTSATTGEPAVIAPPGRTH